MRGAEIKSQRLTIRTPVKGDGVKYARYYQVNREFLQPFSPHFDSGMFSAAEWEASVPLIQQQFAAGSSIRFLLIEGEEVIGVANLTQMARGPAYSATLGYTLSETHQGKGLMKEALAEIVRYVFETRNLHRIAANYMPRNERSGRLLRSLGFQVEGYARDFLLIDGKWEDHVLTSLTNPNWKA